MGGLEVAGDAGTQQIWPKEQTELGSSGLFIPSGVVPGIEPQVNPVTHVPDCPVETPVHVVGA
ncbi:hypothetical protein A2714_03105 [Candidatus Woesebacteria bacterium RIFCSPHIGHO2_01_FULL_38_9]|uniref:Uncharacterized protein n=2 Tax=Candidatus Woeseibacteriota TaxID=1752722 RepID=A0A1F7Y1J0_9BACT|nr:MAG: hypothetical protein A2714_03105 [Candidatus Woesebacteria bacterium RIFCSPHIGHO2_01_FULL_38_9]OGM59171.1 MAG: hypothetical protein A3A75_03055 [Candidatus Woesebacteria bacterium RIFCSPLOWO2_01_FULL_39_10]